MPTKPKPLTLADLAEILGTTKQAISLREKAGGAPKRSDIEGWQTLLASDGRTKNDPGDGSMNVRAKLAAARLAIARETAIKLKRENRVRAGDVIELAEVRRQVATAEGYFFNELDRMQREFPAMLAGLSPAKVRDQLDKFLKRLRERSREKFNEVQRKVKP
jgi:hypothetical protein